MKLTIIVFIAVCCSFWLKPLQAETLEVEYASFYTHVKKLDDPDTNALRFAFGFKHIHKQRLCNITNAKIVTQKQTLPLSVENNRFTVPTDKILKMAKARVIIELEDQANQCDMSVQLETLPSFLKTEYSSEELILLYKQYQAFFDGMGGILSFMMPSVVGISIHFDKNTVLPEELRDLRDKTGGLVLNDAWLMQGNYLKLPQKPLRITAIVEK